MAGLLAVAMQWDRLVDGVVSFFTNFEIVYGVEIFLFFALIFFVSKILRDNESTKLMVLYWFLILVGGGLRIFDEQLMTRMIFLFYVLLLSAFMLILFAF